MRNFCSFIQSFFEIEVQNVLTILEYLLVSCEFKTSTNTVASIPGIETSVILQFRGSKESFQVKLYGLS